MTLAIGSQLGTYEILAPLGAGGMGEVYRARDSRLGRDVAIKLLPGEVASSPDRLARFEREARTVAGLNHPNIVTLHAIEEDAGTRFLVMELVEGRSLAALVTRGGLPIEQVLDLAIALADALVAAHEKHVVHCDLKPANVMITRDGRLKVLDFGLATLARVDPDLEATQPLTRLAPLSGAEGVAGTVPYMAPEQIRGEALDARADLFSFGILVYELASGVRPFAGRSVADLASAILRDDAPPLTSLRLELPEDLDRIVGRCLEKIPRARFQTALDVANELRGLRRRVERGALPSRPARGTVASVAVLPFVNRSANSEDEYFSDGLADELINMLAKIQGLRVAARTSAFRFKGKHEDPAVIGEKLNVATLLEGSVRKAGSRVRISVQLVKVSDGYPLWSEAYDRMLDDIFAVQDDIAHSVVKELRKTLLGEDDDSQASGEARAEVAQAARGRGNNPQAHRLYLQARHLMERLGRADIARSIEYLQNALELDPEFALAWAELATQYAREADASWVSVADGYGRACGAAKRALELEPDLPEGHAALAWVQMTYDWDWRGAEVAFARALEHAPGNAAVVRRAGGLAWSLGRAEQALAFYRRAVELDPLSASTYHNLGVVLNAADRNVESEDAYRKALDLAPQKTSSHGNLSLVLLAMGREDEALREAEAEPLAWSCLRSLAIIRHALGDRAGSDDALAELIETCANDSAYQIAEVYGMRGASDEAFAWLERAHAQRDGGLTEMKLSPPFRALHGDPRWSAFMIRMGFEDSEA